MLTTLIDAQGQRCVGCGRPLSYINPVSGKPYGINHPLKATFDHVVPKSKTNQHRGNYLAAHRLCNSDKADRDPTGCELIWLDAVNAHTGRARFERVRDQMAKRRKEIDAQEQLSYSDFTNTESQEETTYALS